MSLLLQTQMLQHSVLFFAKSDFNDFRILQLHFILEMEVFPDRKVALPMQWNHYFEKTLTYRDHLESMNCDLLQSNIKCDVKFFANLREDHLLWNLNSDLSTLPDYIWTEIYRPLKALVFISISVQI